MIIFMKSLMNCITILLVFSIIVLMYVFLKDRIFFINSGGTRILICLKKIQHSLVNYGKIWASPVLALYLINIIRIK